MLCVRSNDTINMFGISVNSLRLVHVIYCGFLCLPTPGHWSVSCFGHFSHQHGAAWNIEANCADIKLHQSKLIWMMLMVMVKSCWWEIQKRSVSGRSWCWWHSQYLCPAESKHIILPRLLTLTRLILCEI